MTTLEQVGGNYGQIIRDFLAVAHADDGTLKNAGSATLAAVLATGNTAGGAEITGLPIPSVSSDAATKGYVDGLVLAAQSLAAVLAVGNDAGALAIINLADPLNPQDAATRHYVDTRGPASLATILAGSTDAGASKITNLGTPTLVGDAATKAYVDARNLAAILAAGADANAIRITNLGTPTVASDAATKAYVDALTRTLTQVLAAGASAGGTTITNVGTPSAQTDACTKGYVDQSTFNNVTGSYTPIASDQGKTIVQLSASASTLTLPTNASVPYLSGTVIYIVQGGAGQVTVAAPAGGSLVNPYNSFATFGQNAELKATKIGTDAWRLNGEVA